jgi:hypothetical protein
MPEEFLLRYLIREMRLTAPVWLLKPNFTEFRRKLLHKVKKVET